jgi:hypothetical protein
MVVMFDLIVMRVADNGLGPIGGEHVSRALMQLTGLQRLYLGCTCLLCCFDGGVVCIAREGGREGVCVLR